MNAIYLAARKKIGEKQAGVRQKGKDGAIFCRKEGPRKWMSLEGEQIGGPGGVCAHKKRNTEMYWGGGGGELDNRAMVKGLTA